MKVSSRLVELDKLRLATRKEEAKELASKAGVDPYIVLLPPSASKGGVSEKLVRVCEECKEEFCSGSCIIFQYDSYQVTSRPSLHTSPRLTSETDKKLGGRGGRNLEHCHQEEETVCQECEEEEIGGAKKLNSVAFPMRLILPVRSDIKPVNKLKINQYLSIFVRKHVKVVNCKYF